MVQAVVVNKQGREEEFNKPCFGFMSYINKWYETDEWDEDEDEYICEEIAGFESGNLFEMRFYPRLTQRIVPDELSVFLEKYIPKIHEAMERLPQFYNSVDIEWDGTSEPTYVFKLEDVNMQTTIVGAMMLRNMLQMPNMRQVFELLIYNNIDELISFFVANMMSRGYNFLNRDHLSSPLHCGDESIFNEKCTIEDLKNIYNGGLGFVYQGNWGDTEDGYGRYGGYNEGLAPVFGRTTLRATLIDVMMMKNGEHNDETLQDIEFSICPAMRFSDSELVEFAKTLQKKITEK